MTLSLGFEAKIELLRRGGEGEESGKVNSQTIEKREWRCYN